MHILSTTNNSHHGSNRLHYSFENKASYGIISNFSVAQYDMKTPHNQCIPFNIGVIEKLCATEIEYDVKDMIHIISGLPLLVVPV